MTIQDKNLVWLDLFEFLTYHKKVKLLEIFNVNTDIKKSFLSNSKLRDVLNEQEITKMSALTSNEFLDRKIEEYTKANIKIITIYNPNYPDMLKEIATPPFVLYCKGNTQLLNSYCVGIVGSRKHSDYGLVTTKQYAKALAENNITVVSGMAVGIDTIAHKTALEQTGNTIAVLAGGFNHIYPAINIKLSREIEQSNLLISESAPDVAPLSYLFPIRNRIIAGLSHAIIVTEAGVKSGSMHTANYAFDFNREVFAIPGKINSPYSSGTNQLIKDNKANITLSPDDVFEVLNLTKKEKIENDEINAQLVLNYLNAEKKTFQQLVDLTKLPAQELNAILTELEMTGMITKLANNSYISNK